MIGDTQTQPEDWADPCHDTSQYAREQQAKLNADAREAKERIADMTTEEREDLRKRLSLMLHGDEVDWAEL